MIVLDIIFLIIFSIFMVRGLVRGLVKESISLAGIFFAYVGANFAILHVKSFPYSYLINNKVVEKIIIFTIVFLAIFIAFTIISILLTKAINMLQLGFWNGIGGFFLLESKPFYFLV